LTAAPARAAARLLAPLLAALALAIAPAPASAAAPHPLALGFAAGSFIGDEAEMAPWLDRAAEAGGSILRINVRWALVAPAVAPAGFVPSDPAAPGYRWRDLDAAVRAAARHRMRVMLTVYRAPAWAEAPGRPSGVSAGAWRPRAGAFGAFAQALARRYDGSFPDPLRPGAALPRVSLFEAWNEPNLDVYLAPQWTGRRPLGPGLYRDLLDRFYAGVKRAQPRARVIAGALAPFGETPGGHRTRPLEFLRGLLCLRGSRLKPVRCPRPARFDVLSDHPIAVGSPTESAASPLDVTTPDIWRLTRVLRAAERRRLVRPAGRRRPLWVTEFWYDSSPPDPLGVPLARQARWYEQDLYQFWRQGARVAVALQLRDLPPGKGYRFTSQSGVYFLDGAPKPSRTAFRFPLVARRLDRRRVLVWGIAPRGGRVRIEARRGGRWRTLATPRTPGRPHPFVARVRLPKRTLLRARLGTEASLAWRQR
jgi:hypothetical protein